MRRSGSVLGVVSLCVLLLSTGGALGQTDGTIVAWGWNDHGQCDVPAPNEGFVAASAGNWHSLGLKSDGTIVAWGANGYGQCDVPAPNEGFVAVAAGGWYSLGLKSDGTIVAWGDSGRGRCNVPAPNADFVAVAAGYSHSLGIKSDSTIVAWGNNFFGACDVPAPNADFVAVAAHNQSSLGLKSDGTIVGWGYCGPGNCYFPAHHADFVAISMGEDHSLGLKSDGTIVGVGSNAHGQCSVPAPNADFVAVAAGFEHSLGLKSDGTIVAWGRNDYGQCSVPAPNANFVAVAETYLWHSLAVRLPEQPVPGLALDIKPESCPNPFNITGLRDKGGGNGKDPGKSLNKGGVLPTAIVGSESFDVTEVDVSTLLLEGIAPLRHAYEDVTRPVTDGGECSCTPEGPDGIADLTLKFSCKDIAGAIGDVEDRDVVPLTITGSLIDGTPFEASDCVLILSKGQDMPLVSPEDAAAQKELDLGPIAPNPFTQVTRITYWLPSSQFVKLSIHDAAGRLVRRLAEGVESAGEHVVEWDGASAPSGIYFCRLEVGRDVKLKRIRLVK